MSELILEPAYFPLPPQEAFHKSTATIRGYGGAMGGGKSRALCEEVFDWALEYPGIEVPIFRQRHTSMESTTRKTFVEQVLPDELKQHCRIVNSQGRDYIKFWNGSIVHFVGLDDPVKWFSSEIGGAAFDEAHEIAEDDALTINTRIRQRCKACVTKGIADCEHMPHKMIFTFNPANPGHWLQKWFLLGGAPTSFGYAKDRLMMEGAEDSLGSCEFFFAKATDNPFLSKRYLNQQLAGMKPHMRRRYLDGLWEFIDGKSFFDTEALLAYQTEIQELEPALVGETFGNPKGVGERIRLRQSRNGPLIVWAAPVRETFDEETGKTSPAHRYVVAVDTSSGGSKDYSAIQVVDIEDFSQVAEWQGMIDPDLLAVEAFRLASVYNGALIATEVTGGWGHSVVQTLKRLIHEYRGNPASKPRQYTRPILDKISKQWTDRLGWDTNVKTRFHMLDTLEQVLRERQFGLKGTRTLAELGAFMYPEKKQEQPDYKSPRAGVGANDDLVMALAIGVTVALEGPRHVRKLKRVDYRPQFSVTGY